MAGAQRTPSSVGSETGDRSVLVAVFVLVLMVMSIPSLYFSVMLTGAASQPKTSAGYDYVPNPLVTPSSSNANSNNETRPPLVAVVVCTKSDRRWTSIHSTSLSTILIPSIQRTISSSERAKFNVTLVVGFDTHDAFWENEQNRHDLQATTNISINYLSIPKSPQRPHHIPFNQACRATYEYGADYIVRMNDDSEFKTSEWITKGIQRLSQYDPPFVGVVGPTCHEGNTEILTHDMVHRTHLDIFEDYYPNEFDNWWIDDWITKVYGDDRTTKLQNWVVYHHVSRHGTRYQVTHAQAQLLSMTLERGRERIQEFLQSNATITSKAYRVLGTDRITNVWGPMAALHRPLL